MAAKRFNEFEAPFDRLEARMGRLENKFDGLTTEFHEFRRENERAHGIIERKLDKFKVRVFELEGIVDQNVRDIKELQEVVFES